MPRFEPHRNHTKFWGQVPIRDVVRFASPPREVWPFLKSATCRVKKYNKLQPKAQDCYYVGPSVDHPRDYMRVLTGHRSILTTQNVTWQHVTSAPPAPPQQLPPIAEGGDSTAGEGASGEGKSSQVGGRVEDLYIDSDLDMTEVWPLVPPADDSRTSSDSSNSNNSGVHHALVGRPVRDLQVFGELPALQSGRTRSQSLVLTMSAS